MEIGEFFQTLYLGDRGCQGIEIQSCEKKVRLRIDCISRVRDPSGKWEYYVAEDIYGGCLTFDEVSLCKIDSEGYLPNDYFELSICGVNEGVWEIKALIGSYDSAGTGHLVTVTIKCRSVYLEDPKRPGVKITE